MSVRTKVIIIISIVTTVGLLSFGGYKLFFDNETKLNKNIENNKDLSKERSKQNTDSNKNIQNTEKEEKNKDTTTEEIPKAKSSKSSNKNTDNNKKNDTNKKTESSSKNSSNTTNSTNNKKENNTEPQKKEVVCYPSSIYTNSDNINTYTIWYKETNNVPYSLSNYFYLTNDNSRVVDDPGKCTSYDNTLSWEFKQSSSECSPKTSIENQGNSFSIYSTCIGGFKAYIFNKLGDNIGIMNIANVCRPVTSVTPKTTDYYFNYDQPFHDSIDIGISNFNYTGSENCREGGLSPSFEVTSNDESIITCRSIGIGVYSCRGKKKGTATATVRIWNLSGSATTTVNITAQQYYNE